MTCKIKIIQFLKSDFWLLTESDYNNFNMLINKIDNIFNVFTHKNKLVKKWK